LANLVLHPPRIIRGAIDAKVNGEVGLDFLQAAVDFGLNVYQNPTLAMFIYNDFNRLVRKSNLSPHSVLQYVDHPTRNASHPSRCRKTVEKMQMELCGQPLLFLALAHGAVSAGMDVFLRYGQRESRFHPIRYSRNKLHDPFPRISSEEMDFLRHLSRNRRIVVFDEDQTTEYTLTTAVEYFKGMFPMEEIHPYSNFNALETEDALIVEELIKDK
jgi:hypothetical protein